MSVDRLGPAPMRLLQSTAERGFRPRAPLVCITDWAPIAHAMAKVLDRADGGAAAYGAIATGHPKACSKSQVKVCNL
jgi:hypothetical protein